MAKQKMLALAVACLLLLCGCAPFSSQNVNDLLRAPAMDQGQEEIRKALSAYLSVEPQYKYPKQGSWTSPLRLADLDGDGQDEAVLLYTLDDTTAPGREKGNAVYVAVLEHVDGEWTVVQDIPGLSTDVASIEVENLLGTGTRQLVIGFGNQSMATKTLGVYTYENEVLTPVYQNGYSRYAIDDFTGRGGRDLVVVSREEEQLRMQYVPTEDGRFITDPQRLETVVLDMNFTTCVNIAASAGEDGARFVVIDGSTVQSQLISQIVYYTGERFYVDEANLLRGETVRESALLKSRDIDGDGVVEIPVRIGGSVITPQGDKNLEFVEWKDFSREEPPTKQFGVLDSDRLVYISLPEEWRGAVNVVDGDARGEWKLQNRRSTAVLLEMRIIEDEALPVGAVRVPNSTSSYLVYTTAVTQAQRGQITMTQMS